MKIALTIAGSDSGGGAGIQADLKTFAAHGVYGASAITAVTAQNTLGVSGIFPVPAAHVTAQIEAVASDLRVAATKTGMLVSAACVEAVAAAIDTLDLPLVVVDPVISATTGEALLDRDAIEALKAELLRHALVVTPNAVEAAMLTGRPVRSLAEAREAARALHRLGARAVIVKGGHLAGPRAVDVLFDGHQFTDLDAPRLSGPLEMSGVSVHGTGCTFAAAIAANLALGHDLLESAQRAKRYVHGALSAALQVGRGRAVPNHFWAPPAH